MALSAIIESQAGKIGIWELTEPLSALSDLYTITPPEKNQFAKFTNEKRKKEYLAVRLLIKCMLAGNNEIFYNSSGKPFLKDTNMNISISHSDELVVIMISANKAGIDVETLNRKVKKIAPRVLNEQELADSSEDDLEGEGLKQLLYWCAKEAAFKTVSEKNINFKSDIEINPFKIKDDNGEFFGIYRKYVKLSFRYFFHKNNVIVYCVT
jgi:4'-phosphopantetheinyl transferase